MDTTHDTTSAGHALRYDTQGEAVRELQRQLRKLDYCDMDGPVTADGRFGDRTRRAVEAFQYDYGLTVDGVAGPKTWRALRHALRRRSWQRVRS
ncbi:peptidoglycan-binding domain-containing protein [Dyella sp.]|uniref:peptidoglycan-binding domain-containing protein n=1 Tax=Dyella sp. TaxID=1869338 RepID=UPI002D78780B|nr:peptidoglycan-binding domain-containing protein [Dyella sp.]HET7331645.1 peptidoglycan-binding domain-containing protein [Dyella sp.]